MDSTDMEIIAASLLPPRPDQRDRTTNEHRIFMAKLTKDIMVRDIRNRLLVVKEENGRYRVVAGECRRQAALLAGIELVPVTVIIAMTMGQRMLETYLENSMRMEPTFIERATFYQALMKENDWTTQAELARATGDTTATINKTLTIKDCLNIEELRLVEAGKLAFRAAYALAKAFPSASDRKPWIDRLLAGMTCDELEDELATLKKPKPRKSKEIKAQDSQACVRFSGESSWESILTWLGKMTEAAKRGSRSNLPPSALPTLM